MIVIIDNGMGNIQSVSNALSKLGVKSYISNNPSTIERATAIILPGVGAFPIAMENLKNSSLDKLLKKTVLENKTPFLGICLGMQLLFDESEEQSRTKGLCFIKGKVKRIPDSVDSPVPHVGWDSLIFNKETPISINVDKKSRFYYDHSYFVSDVEEADEFASLSYGHEQKMCVGVSKGNIFGVQFHPEKSQRNGLRLLRNFINYAFKIT
jgi:imidazole glycerol-phosphate synthase subunit HisH